VIIIAFKNILKNYFKKIIFNISLKNIFKKKNQHFYIKNKEGLNLRPPWIKTERKKQKRYCLSSSFL